MAGYVRFVELFRGYGDIMGPDEAVDAAIDECIGEGLLEDYFKARRAEVKSMFLTEFDEEKELELLRKEYREDGWLEGHREGLQAGLEEGRQEGRQEGLAEGRQEGLREGRQEIVDLLGANGMLTEEVKKLIESLD